MATFLKFLLYCAVVLGLVLVGNISFAQGLLFFVALMLGTVFGVVILALLYPVVLDCMASQRPRTQPGCCRVRAPTESEKDGAMVRLGACAHADFLS